jgi:hypothetical protein
MKQGAAIRRASAQARQAMAQLDADTTSELLQIYEQAAQQIQGQLASFADNSDQIGRQHLQGLLRQIDEVITGLGAQRDALLLRGIEQAAVLGVQPFTGQALAGLGAQAVVDSSAASELSQEAVRFVQSFRAADGLVLSDRLWRIDQGAKELLQRAIGSAIVQGWSAARAAAELVYAGQAVPSDLAAQQAGARVSSLQRSVAELMTGQGKDGMGAMAQAQRVLRTEINRAHGEAFMATGERTPGFGGWKFLLSPAHARADICDLLARQNLYGLGAGVYPDRARTPWPAHPNTISFVQIVMSDEITPSDEQGKETELQALQRLSPELREGVLGQTKAVYFDQGLIGKGMIRSSLGRVQSRLRRQGKI